MPRARGCEDFIVWTLGSVWFAQLCDGSVCTFSATILVSMADGNKTLTRRSQSKHRAEVSHRHGYYGRCNAPSLVLDSSRHACYHEAVSRAATTDIVDAVTSPCDLPHDDTSRSCTHAPATACLNHPQQLVCGRKETSRFRTSSVECGKKAPSIPASRTTTYHPLPVCDSQGPAFGTKGSGSEALAAISKAYCRHSEVEVP